MEPSSEVFSRIAPNCSAVCSRDCTDTVALSSCVAGAGRLPSWPADTWAFCACTAKVTSAMVSWKLLSFIGSTQMRIAYCEPNTWKLPTPLMRLIGSWMPTPSCPPGRDWSWLLSVEYSAGDEREIGRGFLDPDALALHFLGEQRQGRLHLVLDLDLGDVGVGPLLEG